MAAKKKTKKKTTTKKTAKKTRGKATGTAVKRKVKDSENKDHLKGMRKLDEKIVQAIRKNAKKGMKCARIVEVVQDKGYDVTYASVRNVIIGATWRHVK